MVQPVATASMLSENKRANKPKVDRSKKSRKTRWKSMKCKSKPVEKSLKLKFDFTDRNDKSDNPSASIIKTRQKQGKDHNYKFQARNVDI